MRHRGRRNAFFVRGLILSGTGLTALVLALLLLGICNRLAGKQSAQQAAERWSAAGDASQISCFFSVNMSVSPELIESFRWDLEAALQEASITSASPNVSARLWADAYSAPGKITVNSERASLTADALGVGGDFFLFHPLKLLYGAYFSEKDLNQDYCILDQDAAWQLFGSNDVAGQIVTIGNTPHVVAGVIERESGRLAEAAGLEKTLIYVSYSTLERLGTAQQINHYEIVMPNPVSGYAYQYVAGKLGSQTAEVETIENTGRFSVLQRLKLLTAFGTRSMNGKAILYPYWENMARGCEDYVAFLTLIAFILLCWPVGMILVWTVILWKKRTWNIQSIYHWLKERSWIRR